MFEEIKKIISDASMHSNFVTHQTLLDIFEKIENSQNSQIPTPHPDQDPAPDQDPK